MTQSKQNMTICILWSFWLQRLNQHVKRFLKVWNTYNKKWYLGLGTSRIWNCDPLGQIRALSRLNCWMLKPIQPPSHTILDQLLSFMVCYDWAYWPCALAHLIISLLHFTGLFNECCVYIYQSETKKCLGQKIKKNLPNHWRCT